VQTALTFTVTEEDEARNVALPTYDAEITLLPLGN
jgi:hypothetical protein